ncbi:S4 domain-containing protein YaaA [Fructobacillus ficulneus]|uniref:S4 domain containing protein YaaA n=1 Tax=Fructobacillus ficulneus TaxID=157463 RepID=A0A0K8MF26_9LACO|nr:S4 domain-containing protein YaaA [Fructobacillus ficulneus]GAO99146.1 S4 domain containing protein YaaA [Fructobacillus ficulneus]
MMKKKLKTPLKGKLEEVCYNKGVSFTKKLGKTMAEEVAIRTAYITLAQLLKMENLIASGGQAKAFLADVIIQVNGEDENRRGKKLYPGDNVVIQGEKYQIVGLSAEELAEEAEKKAILERFAKSQKRLDEKNRQKRNSQSAKKAKSRSKYPSGPGSWN